MYDLNNLVYMKYAPITSVDVGKGHFPCVKIY